MDREERMAEGSGEPEGVLVQVCIKCGQEYMFEDEPPQTDLKCEKCGSAVFRSFYADNSDDEAAADFRETTERDTLTTDPGTDVTQGDLHDLKNM
jgi:DNA-directed RNA polymerase subunit RPC12/RpoP